MHILTTVQGKGEAHKLLGVYYRYSLLCLDHTEFTQSYHQLFSLHHPACKTQRRKAFVEYSMSLYLYCMNRRLTLDGRRQNPVSLVKFALKLMYSKNEGVKQRKKKKPEQFQHLKQ